jgi:hypothetical protein
MPVQGVCSGVYLLFMDQTLVHVGESWNCFPAAAEATRHDRKKEFNRWSFIAIADPEERKACVRTLKAAHNI